MRIGSVVIGPRRATVICALGCVAVAVAAVLLGAPTAPVAVGAFGALAVLALTAGLAECRRIERVLTAAQREQAARWERGLDPGQQTSTLIRELRESVDARLERLAQLQSRAFAVDVSQQAAQWRREGQPPALAGLEDEIALIRQSSLFDPDWYQRRLGTPVADPARHYVERGAGLGIDPHPLFAAPTYLQRFPEALAGWRTPLAHFLATGSGAAHMTGRPDRRSGEPADLKLEYLARGLYLEPDTFVLYRIIGNDLPPRHRAGQGIDNLRFVLDHEPHLPGCEKRWVVNRIVDQRMEKEVIRLLEAHGAPYLHIPFEPEEYRRVPWRFTGLQPHVLTYRDQFAALSPSQRQFALDHVYHDKNLYVMNNNGARNAALRQGRSIAKWVLPWDGNCFVTSAAWEELVAAITQRPYLKYFTVPMARLLDNDSLLRPGLAVAATEEPQLVFRQDAMEEFNPDARYGYRSKVELFYRLQIPGPWDAWIPRQWEGPLPAPSPEAGQCGQAGWVVRLYSGLREAELDSQKRSQYRITAIRDYIDQLDQQLAAQRFDPSRLFGYDEAALKRHAAAWANGEPGPARVVRELVAAASRRPGCNHLPAILDALVVTTLAGYVTGQQRYLAAGAGILRNGLIGWRRRLPLRRYAGLPVRDARELGSALDAVRLLDRAGALAIADVERLRDWLERYRSWLGASEPGRAERAALNHRGTWYDLQVLEIDAYLGDLPGLLATLRRACERLEQQVEPGGGQPAERSDHGVLTNEITNLLGWVRLAAAAHHVGQDLWTQPGPGDCRLPAAFAWLFRQAGPGPDLDRYAVLAHLASGQRQQLALSAKLDASHRDAWRTRQLFAPGAGVRPFWVLGSNLEPS